MCDAVNLYVHWVQKACVTHPTLPMAKTCLKRRLSDDKTVSSGWGRASGILDGAGLQEFWLRRLGLLAGRVLKDSRNEHNAAKTTCFDIKN